MKLASFQKVASFLRSQGIEPKLDMLSLETKEWNKLLKLANEWEAQAKMHTQPELTEEEMEADKIADDKETLFYSAG